MSKRKRSAADDDTASDQQGPRKTRVVDGHDASKSDAEARAAARQAKSERRSKKKDNARKPSKPAKELPEAAESLIPDQLPPPEADTFSSNNDFVSLNGTSDAPKSKSSKKSKRSQKPATQPASNDAQQHRFILFIGNLPYSTTPEAITHHFRALQPFEVRCMTDKVTKKFRGTAFLEFPNYDKMKTCLKLYHHSLFDPEAHLHADADEDATPDASKEPGNSNNKASRNSKPDSKPEPPRPVKDTQQQWQKSRVDKTRRINVELTAGGGGGKSAARRQKIHDKNAKLAEERERFAKKEADEREKKRLEGGDAKGKGTGANADTADGDENRGNVHPSRLRRMRG
jgi:nucleolar protein 6